MKSAWVERDAKAAVDLYGESGIDADLALRVYSTRLLGRDRRLVLHGGGNTSLKTTARDLAGGEIAVLRVKGSGSDMGAIEPAGMPAVRLEPLRALRERKNLSHDDMARVQRAFLIDPLAPSPSVEMLLHAFMPATFIDHTHATAVLSLIDQPNSEELCADVFGSRMGFVPYRMPGFGLAKMAAQVFDKNPKVEGLILDKHGLFTFGASAREAYERMIEMVSLAEARLGQGRKGSIRERQAAVANRGRRRRRADPARRLQHRRRQDRGCLAASDYRIPQQRCHPEFRQRQGSRALQPRRDHTRPCNPHQALAADRTGAAGGQAR